MLSSLPPPTVAGLTETPVNVAGVTVSVAVLAAPPAPATIVTDVDWLTPAVAMVNVAVVAPGATDTDGGGVALGPLEDRGTKAPPVGAGAARVTVPVEEAPP